MSSAPSPTRGTGGAIHWPCLLTGLAIVVGGSIYPWLFARFDGETARADHFLAILLFWAMSAGLIRGVGFIPRHPLWRSLFSAKACAAALVAAGVWRVMG